MAQLAQESWPPQVTRPPWVQALVARAEEQMQTEAKAQSAQALGPTNPPGTAAQEAAYEAKIAGQDEEAASAAASIPPIRPEVAAQGTAHESDAAGRIAEMAALAAAWVPAVRRDVAAQEATQKADTVESEAEVAASAPTAGPQVSAQEANRGVFRPAHFVLRSPSSSSLSLLHPPAFSPLVAA